MMPRVDPAKTGRSKQRTYELTAVFVCSAAQRAFTKFVHGSAALPQNSCRDSAIPRRSELRPKLNYRSI